MHAAAGTADQPCFHPEWHGVACLCRRGHVDVGEHVAGRARRRLAISSSAAAGLALESRRSGCLAPALLLLLLLLRQHGACKQAHRLVNTLSLRSCRASNPREEHTS